MSEIRYNNALGALGTLGLNAGETTSTIHFATAPAFATLAAGDWIKLLLEPPGGSPSANFEVAYLTAFTTGQTTGTITRAQEGTASVAHAAGVAWACGPTASDFGAAVAVSYQSPVTSFTGLVQGVETASTITGAGTGSLVYAVTVDQPCRVRIYATSAEATADIGRAQTVDPSTTAGCLLEVVFTVAGTINLSPSVLLVEQDASPTTTFHANVRCDNGTTLNVTLKSIELES